ncbi:lactate/malate family dehydrogenase [Thiocystis violascens]|uniref:lactate/malate family dehydrogenase n=1 Tax=Thiocystis violascens TaxID=73141 RepID=UPI003CCABB51
MKKIAIIGAGRVGETTAQILAEEEFCREIALFDVREDVPEGVALDILQTAPFRCNRRAYPQGWDRNPRPAEEFQCL